jgi:DNA-binding transcriptional regulator of glucitol operon
MGFGRLTSKRQMRRAILLGIAALCALTAVGIAVAASSAPSTPTILTHPANPTNQTSASFTYSSQAGVTFQCALDGAAFTTCPASGVSYPGPLAPGSHAFKVQAVSGSRTSSAASYTWVVDTTPPTATISFPESGFTYSPSAFNQGCPGGICGKVRDGHGVVAVAISIRQGAGQWWGGSSFNKASETFNAASVESPGANATGWSYPFSLPPDGNYTVHVRATDEAGNVTPAASQAEASFTIQSSTPPAPTITSGPEEETAAKSATFSFSDSAPGVTFLCGRDERVFTACTSPKTYEPIAQGEHTFYVEAKNAAGIVSPASTYRWTVVKGFVITGNLVGALAPGVSQPLALTIENPNGKKMQLSSLTVTVNPGSTKSGCDGPANLQVTQSNASETNTLTVPAKGRATVPSGTVTAPQVLMKDLSTNQDACKGATFTFTYSGTGHS